MKKQTFSILITVSIVILSGIAAMAAVLVFSDKGTYAVKPSLSVAASSSDTAGKTIVVNGPETITTPVHLHSNRGLVITPGGSIAASGSGYLNISSVTTNQGKPFGNNIRQYGSYATFSKNGFTGFKNATTVMSLASSITVHGLDLEKDGQYEVLFFGSAITTAAQLNINFSGEVAASSHNYTTAIVQNDGHNSVLSTIIMPTGTSNPANYGTIGNMSFQPMFARIILSRIDPLNNRVKAYHGNVYSTLGNSQFSGYWDNPYAGNNNITSITLWNSTGTSFNVGSRMVVRKLD